MKILITQEKTKGEVVLYFGEKADNKLKDNTKKEEIILNTSFQRVYGFKELQEFLEIWQPLDKIGG